MGRGEQDENEGLVTTDMTTALRQQIVITGQIAERLSNMPNTQDIVRLMQAAQNPQCSRCHDD